MPALPHPARRGHHLSEGLAFSFVRLLSEQQQLLVLLVPLVDLVETGQQADQQHEGDESQHGEDGHGETGQSVG